MQGLEKVSGLTRTGAISLLEYRPYSLAMARLTYNERFRWKAFYPGNIIIIVIIIVTITKKKRQTIVEYQWYFGLGGITFNSHFKTGCCLSTVNEVITYQYFLIFTCVLPLSRPLCHCILQSKAGIYLKHQLP